MPVREGEACLAAHFGLDLLTDGPVQQTVCPEEVILITDEEDG